MELAMRTLNDITENRPAPKKRFSPLRRFGSDRKGVAAIEFSFLALPFFLIVLALLETSIIFLGELTLDHAVERAGRLVRTGNMQVSTTNEKGQETKRLMTEAEFHAMICGEVRFLFTDCDSQLKVDLQRYDDFSDIPIEVAVNNECEVDDSKFGYAPPGEEMISALRVAYKWPLYADVMRRTFGCSDGTHLMVSMAAFRTEP